MYFQTWHEFICPECKNHNFVCDGDITDMSGMDIESVRCWHCKFEFNHDGKETENDCPSNGVMLIKQKPKSPDFSYCHSGSDGECNWEHCPQLKDGEPQTSGRHCPLDKHEDYE